MTQEESRTTQMKARAAIDPAMAEREAFITDVMEAISYIAVKMGHLRKPPWWPAAPPASEKEVRALGFFMHDCLVFKVGERCAVDDLVTAYEKWRAAAGFGGLRPLHQADLLAFIRSNAELSLLPGETGAQLLNVSVRNEWSDVHE